MSIDYNRNNYRDTSTRPKDYFKDVKNDIPQKEILSIIEVSSQRRKEILESELEQGKLIANKKDFQSWVELLKKNNIIDIKSSFEEMNNNDGPFIIQKNQYPHIYSHPFVVFYQHSNPQKGNNGRIGFIDNQGKFISNKDRNHILLQEKSLMQNYQSEGKPIPIRGFSDNTSNTSQNIQTSSEINIPENNIHTIKKGEFLWKIISEKYNLNPGKDKNTIWQIMEMIRKDQRNRKAIKNIDTIFIGQKLYLPTEVKISQGKGKPEREIKMIQQKTK